MDLPSASLIPEPGVHFQLCEEDAHLCKILSYLRSERTKISLLYGVPAHATGSTMPWISPTLNSSSLSDSLPSELQIPPSAVETIA